MKKYFFILTSAIVFLSCKREFTAPVPDLNWDLFNSASAKPLADTTRKKIEGVYTFEQGAEAFGNITPAKWTYTVNGNDTVYHLSFFCEAQTAYFICEGKRVDSSILLNGYWRRMVNTETGKVRLTITKDNGGKKLLDTLPFQPAGNIIITGTYGFGENAPDIPLRLRYTRPLYKAKPYYILAHRAGGRTADILPASENSVDMAKLASSFGANGIEIDVRLTKDGVPVIFHDATLNERLIQKNGLLGPIENYTYAQLYTLVRLIHGEHIPTLREMLQTVLYNTPLQFVWLDSKYNGSMQAEKDIQAEFLQKAAAMNRNLEIVIGIPDEQTLNNFKQLPNYQNIPSLVEYDPAVASSINARFWGPQWTLGLQNDDVTKLQAQGRKVLTWTLDIPENVQLYMTQGKFNGILTNYPSTVAYYYYVQQ